MSKSVSSNELEENLKKKMAVGKVGLTWVGICQMNLCTRGKSLAVAIAIEETEGLANQKVEAHRNRHRDHEKRADEVLRKHRWAKKDAEEAAS